MILKVESVGKYQLTSVSSTKATLIEGSIAEAVNDNLGDSSSMQTMSATFSKSRAEKLKEPTSQGSLTTVEAIQNFKMITSGVLIIPASYALDVRGMSQDDPTRAWYFGCT